MDQPRPPVLLAWLRQREREIDALLERLVVAESPSLDAAAQRVPFSVLAEELAQLDYVVRRVRGAGVGDHLYARPRARKRAAPFQLVIGHMDTVWPVGTLTRMPVRRDADNLFGPGTYDMKAGLVQLVFALRALRAFDLSPSVTPVILFNTDEEIGSDDSEDVIRRLARGAERAFVLEGGEGADGRLKIARKGVGRFEITVHGRASHAGTSFEQGASAIFDLSHQVQRLFALNDPAHGITVNVGTVDGGLRPNVVAPEATASVGVRVPTDVAAQELERAIRSLQPVVEGCSLEVDGGIGRPPMEPTPRNRLLLASAQRLGRDLGLTLEDAGLVGGGSDANTTSLHTATLDGLGPVGDGGHATDEHVSISSTAERAALLAMLLLEPAREKPVRLVRSRRPRVIIAAAGDNETSTDLVAAWHELGINSELVLPLQVQARLRPADTVLGRLDVLPTLDGVEPGLLELLRLERRGFRVLNPASALVGAHDKLRTARELARAGLPHPHTTRVKAGEKPPPLTAPVVVKPRFGSWGKDVFRCETPAELTRCLDEVRTRPWFRRHGALLQQLIPPRGYDLRVLVAAGTALGAIERVAAAGEWRTNISLGGSKRHCVPPAAASALAVAAAAAIGADLVGVDLLPLDDGYVVVELNGAVEFDRDYSLPGTDVYAEIANALGLVPVDAHIGHVAQVSLGR
ncbi:MAG: M20/M25/M40 family metallo-hydrolase [Gaiellaceae bacterium]